MLCKLCGSSNTQIRDWTRRYLYCKDCGHNEVLEGMMLQLPLGEQNTLTLVGQLLSTLSKRERDVLNSLLKGGKHNIEIANELCITEQTVKFHLTNVYKKLKVRGRTEVIALIYGEEVTEETIQRDSVHPQP